MERVAILGATSQIAKDLILFMADEGEYDLLLYARRPDVVRDWLAAVGLTERFPAYTFSAYGQEHHDAVINFVGVGDPARAAQMGASIFDITLEFDDLVLRELRRNPNRRYLFLSSGAAYGDTFLTPAGSETPATIAINDLRPQEYYSVAKLHAECRHRSLDVLPIIDIRVFNYFSRTQDLSARFFITDILRAILEGVTLRTSSGFMVRDFLHPSDFHQLVRCALQATSVNVAVDCYSRAPVDKPTLLEAMSEHFGLNYEVVGDLAAPVNATGAKPYYYSLNRKAATLGYQPVYASLDGVIEEAAAILRLAEM